MTKRPYDTQVRTRTVDAAPVAPPPVVSPPAIVEARKRASAEAAAADQPIRVAPAAGGPFVYVQATPATVWSIRHALGRYPQVSVLDEQGRTFVGAVRHYDVGWTELTFSEPVVGKAVLT